MRIAAGGLLALLFAPDKGAETRKKISKKGGTILNKINGTIIKKNWLN